MITSEKQLISQLIDSRILNKEMNDLKYQSSGSSRNTVSYFEELISEGSLDRDLAIPFLKERIQLLSANELNPDPDTLRNIPYKYASFYSLLPLKIENDILHCALSNPFDASLKDEIETVLGIAIEPVWAFSADIKEALQRFYGLGAELKEHNSQSNRQNLSEISGKSLDNSLVKLVEEILLDAVSKRATDIHIEPHESRLRVRYRIDGILYEQNLTKSFLKNQETIVARLKVLANLNLADKRKPQDGRIKTNIKGHQLDMRVSILPTVYGETVDIRILDDKQINLELSGLGFDDLDLSIVKSLLTRQNGIILVTGPTGSGKTTTLYSFLRRLNTTDCKIITIEDPIEYQLDGITQLQVHTQIDFTFANGLRSMLRHDPDIMMVGEIRDPETAKIAIQVALTGHLVLSTVHTNDSVSTLTRLQDMGVERYLLTSTLQCIIAQRLVRRICPHCKTESKADYNDIDFQTYEGKGCAFCNNTGYFGRVGVFEILKLDSQLKDLIINGVSTANIKEKAISRGLRTLYQSGIEKVKAGITTYAEILRILHSVE
jgi:type II secretory ATPase GspE/PulE/Tfp pilus assembly ATPase PilB-like protein